jgi:hypothetical protein
MYKNIDTILLDLGGARAHRRLAGGICGIDVHTLATRPQFMDEVIPSRSIATDGRHPHPTGSERAHQSFAQSRSHADDDGHAPHEVAR